jgi:glycosyltransferase involved in cell wall biosynthesis
MRGVDAVVVPSLWWENSPLIIQEAAAAGRPVLGSDLGGIAEKLGASPSNAVFRVSDAGDLLVRLAEMMRVSSDHRPARQRESGSGVAPLLAAYASIPDRAA